MVIPQSVIILGHTLPFIWFFLFSGVLTYFFVFWYEGRREGFPEKNLFNLAFILLFLTLVSVYTLPKIYSWLSIFMYRSILLRVADIYFVYIGTYLLVLLQISLFAVFTKWSVYRLLDMFAQSVLAFVTFYFLATTILYQNAQMVFPLILTIFIGLGSIRLKGYKMASGMLFSFLNLVCSLLVLFIYPKAGYLIIALLLVTIALVSIYLRQKGAAMSYQLPSDLIEQLKNKLLKRAKDIKKGEDLLKQEDAYSPSRRDTPSTENIDGAILEDYQKELTDKNRDLLKKVRSQISKALLFMTAGKYGICEVCGKPIDKARLKIYPEATRCIECAAKSE